jgi:phosphatidate phosphatase APP1
MGEIGAFVSVKKHLVNLALSVFAMSAPLAAYPMLFLSMSPVIPAKFTPFDALARPGERISLSAKLERADRLGISLDVEGQVVVFGLEGRTLGNAVTGDDGVAHLEATAPVEPGNHRVRVNLAEGSKFRAGADELLLAVRNPADVFMITDIDHTISDISQLKVPTAAVEEMPPLKDSVAVLGRISRRYTVIYVSHRDDRFIDKTRKWLRYNGFPEGPAFFADIGHTSLSAEEFKTGLIATLKARWPNIVFGVGDRQTDGAAYAANGIRAYVITEAPDDNASDAIFHVRGWTEVEGRESR